MPLPVFVKKQVGRLLYDGRVRRPAWRNRDFLVDQGKPAKYLRINRDIPGRYKSVGDFFCPGCIPIKKK